jgi:hypothetical protein
MKLIIIHGPPAAGKLTVANEVARRTGFKVFHNHLSIDCVRPVFDFGTKPFGRLIELIRVETIAEAARENVDMIHTFVYAKGPDDEHFAKLVAAAEENGGKVCLVLLSCEPEVGRLRVTSESRSRMGKVATPEMLDSLHQKYDLLSPLDGRGTLVIDNSNLSATDAAEKIIGHFELPLQPET